MSIPKRCVIDLNIVIDLHIGQLVEPLFSMGTIWLTTDLVLHELRMPTLDVRTLRKLGLKERSLAARGPGRKAGEIRTAPAGLARFAPLILSANAPPVPVLWPPAGLPGPLGQAIAY